MDGRARGPPREAGGAVRGGGRAAGEAARRAGRLRQELRGDAEVPGAAPGTRRRRRGDPLSRGLIIRYIVRQFRRKTCIRQVVFRQVAPPEVSAGRLERRSEELIIYIYIYT